MNQGNFQNMSIPMQAGPQPAGPPASTVQQYIHRTVSQQPVPQGWQASVQTQFRVTVVFHLYSQLRLLQSQFDLQQALNLALSFEAKAFAESPDRSMYEQHYQSKLEEIHALRVKHSAAMQQQVNQQRNMPQHMQNMAQAMAHNQAHGHVQFQPGPPNAQQQQMMQMQGIPMPQQPQQPAQQQPNMTMGPRPGAMPQAQPSASQPIPQQQNQYNPAPHENELIIQMANQLQASAPPQRLQAIQNSMRQINPEQRENLARQGLDPVHAYFRREAMKRFWEMKRAQASSQGAPAAQSAAMTNGITRPPQDMARSMGQPASGPQQNFETPFDQIVGQQQDGLRSQEAGQVVVPASNPQANIDQRNAARANAPQQVSMQNGGTRVLQNANANHPQTQTFWSSQGAQRNANPGAGVNGNTAAANFSNANQPPSNVLQGQPGGLDNQITRTPSQTPGMPNLNKAAAPPGQTPNMWSHRTPQLGQGTPQATPVVQPGMQQPAERPEATQQRPLMIPNMPPQMQQHLATLPEDQQRSFLMNLRRHQQHHQQMQQQANQQAAKAANARAAMSDSLPMSSQPSQPGMQPGTTAAMPNQNMAVSQAMMHKANGLQSAFAPQLSTYGGPARQQPGSGQQPPQQRGTPQHPGSNANPPPSLTKEQIRQMDQRIFPANLLREGMAHIPQEVKTWGQLKEFAMKRAQQLPQGLLPKLEHLQAIQYRTLQQGPGPAQSGSLPPGSAQQQQAPFAQMVSQPNGQAPIAAPRPPNGMRIPQPTAQEVQVMRARLPPTAQSASDDQIRIFLMKQKHETLTRSMQQGQNNQMVNGVSKSHQDIPNQVQGDTSASDVNQLPQTGQAKSQTQQSQKGAGPASKQSQGNRNTSSVVKQTQKGVKRNSNDDVVEVPNPSLANSQASLQAPKQNAQTQEEKARANIKSSVNQSTTDQSQNAASQNARPPGVPNLPKEELDRRDARLRQLMTEVGQNQPLRRPVPMSPQTRTEMGQKLQGMRPMIARMESSLPSFFRSNANENFARQLIETRLKIKAQYRDQQSGLVDQFTISPKELEDAENSIKQYFVYVMSRLGHKRNNNNIPQPAGQQQNQQQAQRPPVIQEKAPLSTANLKEQQNMIQAQRQAAMQKQGHGSRVPAAPTSDKPPFPLGPQSPHGIPAVYGPATLTADQLVLPQNKRRKSNHPPSAGSTPLPAQEAAMSKSSPFTAKPASPEVQRAAVPQMSFKCGVSSCSAGQKGFATQAELEQHNADKHEPKEPVIEDPLEFALESMRSALGLDGNGKSKAQRETLEAPKMKASLSAQSDKAIKQEASTPMARASTQTGPSPASNLKTPQAMAGVKTSASDTRSTIQEGKGEKGKANAPKEATPPPFDPWAGSYISADEITSAWSSLADMQSLSFTKIQMGLTPSSTLSIGNDKSEKNSPRPSDISENDAVKINLDVGNEEKDNWIPRDWFEDSLYGGIESLNFGQDHFTQPNLGGEELDWDIFADLADTVMVDAGASSGKGRKKDEAAASDEWLKVYAPNKLTAKKGGR